jgi:SAM-dependent methyltransferase
MYSDARAAYDNLAPFYDRFTEDYAHTALVSELVALARGHGQTGERALDVACGTGKSTVPLAGLGYDATGCDLSPEMVRIARERLDGGAFVADMRSLPRVGPFDLVTCLDDSVNYLLTEDDLGRALASIAAQLRPGGQLVFDTNTIVTYRRGFSATFTVDAGEAVIRWRGQTSPAAAHGSLCGATVEVFDPPPGRGAPRVTSVHRQRHHPARTVREAVAAAGLRLRAVRGLLPGGALSRRPSEDEHPKLVYLADKEVTA